MPQPPKRSIPLPRLETPAELRLRTWVQMVRTFYRMQRRLEQTLAAHGVTLPQFDLLATLRFRQGVTQQELAESLLVTKGNVCGLLDRLETLGWVQRRPDDSDRRVNRLHLTAAGLERIDALLPDHDQLMLHMMRHLDDSSLNSLRSTLEAMEAGVEPEQVPKPH